MGGDEKLIKIQVHVALYKHKKQCNSLHEGVTFSIHFLICTGSTLFTLVARPS